MSDDYNGPEGTYFRLGIERGLAQQDANGAGVFSRKRTAETLRRVEEEFSVATERWIHSLLSEELEKAWAITAPDSNAWHPNLLDHLPQLATSAAAAAQKRTATEPQLQPRLTAQAAAVIALDEVEKIQAVIDDPRIYRREVMVDGIPAIVLQHAASALRGRFHRDPQTGFGVVLSKPYSIDSIDPYNPNEDGTGWKRYAGLGIGRRIYLLAASIDPHLRWDFNQLSDQSQPLRTRLHDADPYRWAAKGCAWCTQNLIDWRKASVSAFSTHPIRPAPAVISPRVILVP